MISSHISIISRRSHLDRDSISWRDVSDIDECCRMTQHGRQSEASYFCVEIFHTGATLVPCVVITDQQSIIVPNKRCFQLQKTDIVWFCF